MPALPIRKIIRLRYNLDIPGFIRAAIRYNLNKEQVLIYFEIIATSTHDAIEEMGHFVSIAKQEDLTRNEILAWLHLSYGGLIDPMLHPRKHSEKRWVSLQDRFTFADFIRNP